MIAIGPFRLDLDNQTLERDGREVELSPKAFAVLRHLTSKPGSLVTKQELLDAVWTDTFVQEGVLKAYVKEIRRALGDDADNPQYIRTEHRRGYRFLTPSAKDSAPVASGLAGRDAELAILRGLLAETSSTESRIVFVTGEAGIGKTAVVDAFLAGLSTDGNILIARGQCIEQSGEGEPYLPMFEALSHLSRQHGAADITDTLRKHAPMWLMQMPSLVAPAERHKLQLEIVGSNGQRMIREMIEALSALTVGRTFVLALEDLHWGDPSTIDLLGALARRPDLRRLLVLVTYRPVDVILSRHPVRSLKQDLQAKGQCRELALELLPVGAVEQYIGSRFASASSLDAAFAKHLHKQTDGNPLFLIKMTDYLVAQDVILPEGDSWRLTVPVEQLAPTVPDNLRQMIEHQFERLTGEQQRILEAGAIAGIEFRSSGVAAALGLNTETIEEHCESLAEGHMFLRHGKHAAADDSERFAFVHAIYRDGLYQRITTTKRRRLHLALAEHGERVGDHSAAGLATHFEMGGNATKAILYLRKAAAHATQSYAKREALDYLNRAHHLVAQLPAEAQAAEEMALRRRTAELLRFMGDAAGSVAELTELIARAGALGRIADEVGAHLEATTSLMWVDRRKCVAATERAVALSEQLGDAELIDYARGYRAFWRILILEWTPADAEAFERGRVIAERSPSQSARTMYLWMSTAMAGMQCQYALSLERADRCIASALEIGDAYHYLATLHFRFWSQFHSGQLGATLRTLKEVAGMSETTGLSVVAGSEGKWRKVLSSVGSAAVHLEARDYEAAVEGSMQIWRDLRTRSLIMGTGSLVFASATAASGLIGLGRLEEARKVLYETLIHSQENNLVMEPRVEMFYQLTWAEYKIRVGAFEAALLHAERVLTLALRPGESGYIARARRTLAESLLGAGRAQEALEQALSACAIVKDLEIVGRWHVFATAALCSEAAGQHNLAREQRTLAADAIRRYVDSLDGFPELQQCFLANPEVRSFREVTREITAAAAI